MKEVIRKPVEVSGENRVIQNRYARIVQRERSVWAEGAETLVMVRWQSC